MPLTCTFSRFFFLLNNEVINDKPADWWFNTFTMKLSVLLAALSVFPVYPHYYESKEVFDTSAMESFVEHCQAYDCWI